MEVISFDPKPATPSAKPSANVEKTLFHLVTADDATNQANPAQGWGEDSIRYFTDKLAEKVKAAGQGELDAGKAIEEACSPALEQAKARGGDKARVIQVGLSAKTNTSTGKAGVWSMNKDTFAHEYSQANFDAELPGYSPEQVKAVRGAANAQISSAKRNIGVSCVAANENEPNSAKPQLKVIENLPTIPTLVDNGCGKHKSLSTDTHISTEEYEMNVLGLKNHWAENQEVSSSFTILFKAHEGYKFPDWFQTEYTLDSSPQPCPDTKTLPVVAVGNAPLGLDFVKFVDAPKNYKDVEILGLDADKVGTQHVNLEFDVDGEKVLIPIDIEVVEHSDPRLKEIKNLPVYQDGVVGKDTDEYRWTVRNYADNEGNTGGTVSVYAKPGYKFPDGFQTEWTFTNEPGKSGDDETTKPGKSGESETTKPVESETTKPSVSETAKPEGGTSKPAEGAKTTGASDKQNKKPGLPTTGASGAGLLALLGAGAAAAAIVARRRQDSAH